MPWLSTRAFPHPLANLKSCAMNIRAADYFSFMLTDTLMWLSLKGVINSIRTETHDLMLVDVLSTPASVQLLNPWHSHIAGKRNPNT